MLQQTQIKLVLCAQLFLMLRLVLLAVLKKKGSSEEIKAEENADVCQI